MPGATRGVAPRTDPRSSGRTMAQVEAPSDLEAASGQPIRMARRRRHSGATAWAWRATVGLAVALLVLGCSHIPSLPRETVPAGEWQTVTPEQVGWSAESLEAARAYSER